MLKKEQVRCRYISRIMLDNSNNVLEDIMVISIIGRNINRIVFQKRAQD